VGVDDLVVPKGGESAAGGRKGPLLHASKGDPKRFNGDVGASSFRQAPKMVMKGMTFTPGEE